MITKTGGSWDPNDWPVYFAASNPSVLLQSVDVVDHLLLAVNELEEGRERDEAGRNLWQRVLHLIFSAHKHLLIDSGVYWLSTQHAKNHHLSMDQALTMEPDKIDGFDELFEKYVALVREFGDRVWGYIEIDQGGRANKIKTRQKLEKMGLRPIPVYHPFNDGWDYFDYLAERYDRICFGNVVMADIPTRKRLCATAWERRRKYPHLWIHLLGMTPGDILTAFPINSCDSSSWVGGLRWDNQETHIAGSKHNLAPGFTYVLASKEPTTGTAGWDKAVKLSGYNASMLGRTMKNIAGDQLLELGADIGMFEKKRRKR